ncbi:MAG: hypothetical protein LKE47_01260 [Prevotella sp.]|jgi:hypothetical protein|nr:MULTISPECIES: hypothetical protein [unclassified Prevotella]MCH3969075.1 hypothetical protein [Prevotella sp.]MCH3985153.1 hypothetical protein [Prevotella sp.]MCH4017347.1 hypothetical protein [Prevotella sp.]MCH4099681.1 hypothetical protein [Prevotella sp.]MCH4185787.1 hypothetical protein [Prevotella sp.]
MKNKRFLKRRINYICSDLFAECIAADLYGGRKTEKEDVEALLTSILTVHSNFISRISHPEPGMKPQKYFQDLKEDFNKQISEIIDQVSNLGN